MCGVAPAIHSTGYDDLVDWIESGYAGQMSYFADRVDAYRHPAGVMEGAKSIIVLAYPYASASVDTLGTNHGKVARYARSGVDYHDVIHPKLNHLCGILRGAFPESHARGVVDTAPLMEREIAELAGLGWRGKNTLLLNKSLGSYYFLACVLTDIELTPSASLSPDHCGTCTACLDACPTDAFVGPHVLDATRCISYLTIEHRGPIDPDLRTGIGDWVFGCDVCQEVCPWNRKPVHRQRLKSQPLRSLELTELFTLDEDQFRERFRKTPMWRTRRRGLLRNAAIVLGNQRKTSSIAALSLGLADDDPVVRGASAWALGQIGDETAINRLRERQMVETDTDVQNEIAGAIA